MPHPLVTEADITAYARDGAVLIKGLFADHVETLRAGVARNMAEPGPYAAENLKPGEGGRFFDDYCNWQRIPEFEEVIHASAVAEVAAALSSKQCSKKARKRQTELSVSKASEPMRPNEPRRFSSRVATPF